MHCGNQNYHIDHWYGRSYGDYKFHNQFRNKTVFTYCYVRLYWIFDHND